jgi:hypothetical protein
MQVRELLRRSRGTVGRLFAGVNRVQPGSSRAPGAVRAESVTVLAPVARAGDSALESRQSTGVDRDGLEVSMRSHRLFAALAPLLLALVAGPAFADGRWIVSFGVGESMSELHGSAIEAAAYAQLHPLLGLGFETGMAYMKLESEPVFYYPVEPGGGIGTRLASLTDGLTRNRGLYMGPALRIGQQLYAVASAGVYEFSDNDGNWLATRWGGSAGLGLTGKGRFSPRAEIRSLVMPFERMAAPPHISQDASAIVFTIGVDLH